MRRSLRITFFRPEAGNSISKPLDFKLFWGSMPPDPPSGSRLRRSRAPPARVPPHLYYPYYGTEGELRMFQLWFEFWFEHEEVID